MTRARALALAAVLALGCRGGKPPEAPAAAPAVETPAAGPGTPTPPATGTPGKAAAAPDLQVEEREQNPRSEMVKLRLMISPQVPGAVFWGIKNLGPIGPKPLDLDRPRNSGPMDIVVKAAGYLPYHARLFTDRDDRLAIRLVRNDEASGTFGYRRPPTPTP